MKGARCFTACLISFCCTIVLGLVAGETEPFERWIVLVAGCLAAAKTHSGRR